MSDNPEIAKNISAAGIMTNYHDLGSGNPVMFIHGSGPGVSAWVNWRLTIPECAKHMRVIAPDMVGFGFTERPNGIHYGLDTWVEHAVGVLDALGIDRTDIVGNSFGGAISLALAIRYPHRVRRLVLMGSVGIPFDLTPGLDAAWGYEASLPAMRNLLDIFAYDRTLVTDELANLRYRASIQPGFQESFASMFPAPRQRWIDALASNLQDIEGISNDTLIIHGREDKIIPLDNSLRLHHLIKRSQLHVFGGCGHWTQIEHGARFNRLVCDFLTEQ